jgi:P-type Ca2+ transporter type 2C
MPLMMEPKEKGLLNMPPRDPKIKLANRLFFIRVGLVSVVMAGTAFSVYWVFGHYSISNADIVINQAQTAAFMSVVMVHLGYVMTARSIHRSGFTINPFSNKWLLGGVAFTIVSDLLIVYLPPLNSLFKTVAFPVSWWPLVLVGLPAGFFVPEIEKLIRKKTRKRRLSM